jgi:hypothetical protein
MSYLFGLWDSQSTSVTPIHIGSHSNTLLTRSNVRQLIIRSVIGIILVTF